MEDSLFMEIGLPVALALVMVGIGLTLTLDDFRAQSKSRKGLALAVLGQCVLIPLIGLLVARLVDAPPELAVGLVLVAATPGGATSNLTAYLGRGNVALGIVATVTTSLIAIVSLPIWVDRALHVHQVVGADGAQVTVPLRDVLSLLMFIIFVPIVIGLTIKRKLPDLAARLERMVGAFSIVVLLVLILGILIDLGSDALPMLRRAGPASLVISVAACALAFLLGALGRLPRKDTIAIGCEFGIKNITLGILIGLSVLHSEAIALPSAIYAIVMYLPTMGVVMIGRRWFPEEVTSPVAQQA